MRYNISYQHGNYKEYIIAKIYIHDIMNDYPCHNWASATADDKPIDLSLKQTRYLFHLVTTGQHKNNYKFKIIT